MQPRKIKLVIDSDLNNVSLVGVAANRLCDLVPVGKIDPYEIELCVVEAVNNCIEHAYGEQAGQEVEVVFSLHPDRLVVEICDRGKPMDPARLERTHASSLDIDRHDLTGLAEEGRGLAIMKQIMDQVRYQTEEGKNCLTMVKRF